jgi:hypothetical protein
MAFKLSKSLQQQVQAKAVNYILARSPERLTKEFEDVKQRMVKEFLNHPITKEINAGAYASNTSGTLSNVSNGNLFSFIGFELGDNPTEPIQSLLENIEIRVIKTSNSISISILYPTPQQLWEITPMPWQEGRSWAKGIESGISGLNYYFFSTNINDDVSRSSTGIQSNKQIRSYARYTPTSYISTLLKKYRTIFSSKYSRNKSVFVTIEQ